MPTLAQATQPSSGERSTLAPARPIQVATYPGQDYPPDPNPFLRCPLPPVNANADSLRQFYRGGLIPQNRIMTPATLSQNASGSGGTTIVNSSVTTNSTTIVSKAGTIQTASITTPVLNPGDQYQSTLNTSTAFAPFLVSVSGGWARVELYATASAQTLDQSRPITQSPGPAMQQGIVLDVSIDTPPFSWIVTPSLPAANGDSPRSAQSYVTVNNIGPTTGAITVSVQFLVLEA